MIDLKRYETYKISTTEYQINCCYKSYYDDGSYRGTFKGVVIVEDSDTLGAFCRASCIDNKNLDQELFGVGGCSAEDIYSFLNKWGCKKKEDEQLSLFEM